MATYWENSCSFGLRYVSWYKCLIVSLVFSHLGFWSGNLFLIAPFPDFCLLVHFYSPGASVSAFSSYIMSKTNCAIIIHYLLLDYFTRTVTQSAFGTNLQRLDSFRVIVLYTYYSIDQLKRNILATVFM